MTQKKSSTPSFSDLWSLGLSSWETIGYRTLLAMQGRLTQEECQRMVLEKTEAVQETIVATFTGAHMPAMLSPWSKRAGANARRLRRTAFSGV